MDLSNEKHDKIDSKCAGCGYVVGDICRVYLSPSAKWRAGNCVMCTTLVRRKDTAQQKKKRIGQAKQAKSAKVSKKQQQAYSKLG